MSYRHTIGGVSYVFADLRTLLARATPLRSGDQLAGVAAATAQERVAAQKSLADVSLTDFLSEVVVPYETDEVTRLIVDTHDRTSFAPVSHLTVGGFRDWLLSDAADTEALSDLAPGLTPEMAAAVSKIMRLQDLIAVGAKCRVVTKFRDTIGLPGRLSTRVQPNHPTDDPRGVAASILDGLRLGGGDAVIGINPATDNTDAYIRLVEMMDVLRCRLELPTQSCVLSHVTTAMDAMRRGAPVDLVFQSVAGTEAANQGFGITLAMLGEAHEMALALGRGTVGDNVMYFETGQGSALSANAHHGVDQQTVEARAYAVARRFRPLLVNTVVGFIGPEYLFDGKQITRAGLEDHLCGKLLGVPMGCDICYTNHAEADQDDMDGLLTLLGVAGVTFIMGLPGADDVMLNYQSTSFHDALYIRRALHKRPAPEFEAWQERTGILDSQGAPRALPSPGPIAAALNEIAPAGGTLVQSAVWDRLRQFTPARIGIETTGVSQPTGAHLAFQWDHAQARDAVYSGLDVPALTAGLEALGLQTVVLHSDATDRHDYLQRPDRGRRLSDASQDALSHLPVDADIIFVIADGLSATAVNQHAVSLLGAVLPTLQAEGWHVGPAALVRQGRVAVGDGVAVALNAAMVVTVIGERPGLTAADSVGVYLTWHPRADTRDSERNCLSNIRPAGLPFPAAAAKMLYLMRESRRRRLSGVELKENAGDLSLEMAGVPALAARE